MPEYRDYGQLGYNFVPRVEVNTKKYSQVFLATHEGESSLPFMKKSFISFSFGGKKIEDFNLIAVSNGNYLQFKGYSDFEDITSDYDVLDGHFYWGTHHTEHVLNFSLATDGIMEDQLQKFLSWFSAGKTRELILSEHPNRAIMARVSTSPELNLSPFEKKTTVKISGKDYETSTTEYRGSIILSLTTEEPYWYSKVNIFGYLDSQGVYHDVWYDANGNERNVYQDPDVMKIVLEDNIPISGMIQNQMLLGDNKYANTDSETGAQTAEKNDYLVSEWQELPDKWVIATVDNYERWLKGARLSGTIISETEGVLEFSSNENQYFYYAGTAPSAPIIKFTLTPQLNANGYINTPANSKASTSSTGYKPYNTITIESLNKKELRFTTPSVYTAYNQAIDIFRNMNSSQTIPDIREQIRDKVNHPAVRAWANKIIDNFTDSNRNYNNMQYFLKNQDGEMLSSTFIIDNKTGEVTGKLQYRDIVNGVSMSSSNAQNYGTVSFHEEDVGDMICSNHLIIEDRNQPTESGSIMAWSASNETTRLYSHRIKHDVVTGLKNFFITYKNMYL